MSNKDENQDHQEAFKSASRSLARALWMQQFKGTHPSSTKEDEQVAWQSEREAYIASARQALRRLEAQGYEIRQKAG